MRTLRVTLLASMVGCIYEPMILRVDPDLGDRGTTTGDSVVGDGQVGDRTPDPCDSISGDQRPAGDGTAGDASMGDPQGDGTPGDGPGGTGDGAGDGTLGGDGSPVPADPIAGPLEVSSDEETWLEDAGAGCVGGPCVSRGVDFTIDSGGYVIMIEADHLTTPEEDCLWLTVWNVIFPNRAGEIISANIPCS